MENKREELAGLISQLREERNILDETALNDRIKKLEETVILLDSNNRYTYFSLEERIKILESIVSRIKI